MWCFSQHAGAQARSADSCFALARQKAFADSNYSAAIAFAREALALEPGYTEAESFLARLYWWNQQPDSAIALLRQSEQLRKDSAACRLRAEYIGQRMRHRIGVGYETVTYSDAYNEALSTHPWQQWSVWYLYSAQKATLGLRINQAWQGDRQGTQAEVEAYPRLGKRNYLYLHSAFATQNDIYPDFRAGASWYTQLPKGWELEAGMRYLHFESNTWVYVGGLSKYLGAWLLNARAYIGHNGDNSVNASIRYYFGGANQYLAANFGTGVSPDNRSQNGLLGTSAGLNAFNLGGQYRFLVRHRHAFELHTGWRIEQLPEPAPQNGNQFTIGAGYQYIF